MANVGHLREFDPKQCEWTIYKARLEQYFIANLITDKNIKRAILLNCCNEESYQLIYNLSVPVKPETKDYDNLIGLFSKHFSPKTSRFPDRYKFYNAFKEKSETISDWAVRVRSLASKCDFGGELGTVLRDRFIMGIEKGSVLNRLFEEDVGKLTFEDAVQVAICKEATRHNFEQEGEVKMEPEVYRLAHGFTRPTSVKQRDTSAPGSDRELHRNRMICCVCGFVVQFFSYPVISGFTSAAALQIASSQLNGLLGIPRKANEFLDAWETVITYIDETKLWDTLLGFVCMIILIAMRELRRFGKLSYNPQWSKRRNFFGRMMFLMSLGRNALVVMVATLMSYIFISNGYEPFAVTGTLGKGMPSFQMPSFTIEYNNETYPFKEVAETYAGSIAFIPLVCILESIAISKAFSKGKTLDATQEMLAVGISNIMGSFVGSMPVTGSFTRTAVNNASGVQTTFGGVITGTLVLLALALLTSTFYYIPKATLAAVVITAMIYLFDFEAIALLWKTKKLDLIPFTVTLLLSLFLGLEYGILIGIGTNLLFVLYTSSRPSVNIEMVNLPEGEVFIVTPSRDLQFPAAEYVREKVMKDCNYQKTTIVLDGKYITNIDATVAKNLKTLSDDIVARTQNIVFWNFESKVREICTGVDSNLCRYFREGKLEDIIDNPALERVDTDGLYTIQ